MLTLNSMAKIRPDYTSNLNVTPNPDLDPPSIIPPYIAKDQSEFTIFVLIAPYPDMQVGDKIELNIGGAVTEPYEIAVADLGNQINIQLSQDSLSSTNIVAGEKIPIAYTVDSDKYPTNNTSSFSYLNVANELEQDLGNVIICNNITDTTHQMDTISRYTNIISNDVLGNSSDRMEIYIFITVDGSNKFYYDRIAPAIIIGLPILLLVELKWIIDLAGSKLNIWMTGISIKDDGTIVHSSTVSSQIIPRFLEANLLHLSDIYLDIKTLYLDYGSTYIHIDKNQYISSGDSINLSAANSNVPGYSIFVSDNFANRDIAIPYFYSRNSSDFFQSEAFISYDVGKGNYTIVSGSVKITPI
ncbi:MULTISPECIES: hypothetical protein [unclassified Brucella]|uniref:hypothetical protein n=1 Tax=unclassified Brucella TaxID=2632610 RepID=UPI0012AE81FF|nr:MULTISPECIES: hypothetical protein [unclassified Brucella]MRN43083.1 hypothetical protein [Brucella sp. 09RB8913]MRN60283.1 hypothetical protein [Brucella sp. 09RB8918]CAB4326871.1 hypothetical protein BCH_02237 [Brucella sp. 191011898]